MAEEAVVKVGAILEQLNARFELVIEAVSGFRGRLDTLREEMFGQLAEVGKQIRFLCDQVAEERQGLSALRSELTAEMVRLGEALGANKVDFRQELNAIRLLQEQLGNAQRRLGEELASSRQEARRDLAEKAELLQNHLAALAERLSSSEEAVPARSKHAATDAGVIANELRAELKQTNKSLTALSRKFDRFDDRVTIQVKDHEDRLRKTERRAR